MYSHTHDFTPQEKREWFLINDKPEDVRRETRAFYRKTGFEHGPTNAQKKEFVHRLINNSRISLEGKMRLEENLEIIPHFQFRGFKYGIVVSSAVFFLLPVVNRQLFLRRLAISSIPFFAFMRWGYIWGHEKWWRKTYPVIATYEIASGIRNQFTGK